jgi:hypothetical protein
MCVNCGVSSCSSCNPKSYLPSNTSALKFDGNKFVCPTHFTLLPGQTLNETIQTLAEQICENANSGGGGTGLLQEVTVNITADEILAMHTTPKELLPAASFAYDIFSIVLKPVQVTNDYVYVGTGTDYKFAAQINTPLGTEFFMSDQTTLTNLNTVLVSGVSSASSRMVPYHINPTQSTFNNSSIELVVPNGGQMTVGNHDMIAIITYREIPA